MKQFRILLVDDEERILNFLRVKLTAMGYGVLTASNGLEAIEQAQSQEPDLIVLDVVMPKMGGLETLRQLRTFTSVPVIFLSGQDASAQKTAGLSLGADDYLAKPFSPDELVARIEAIKRRLSPDGRLKVTEPLQIGDLTIDFNKRLILVKGEQVHLTRIEWLLLAELANNIGRLITYEDLLTKVWGLEYRDDVKLLRTWISRLRNKIEKGSTTSPLIRTLAKTGYFIDKPSS
ncbi:MAG: response regulator transcription factor [Dehalococcoidia bacterium]|nr:response regulator transcription factor [Dehalococcoidia bacterium]MBF8304274.1 response regulator transcription factor [Dehalococcoidia bacterium]MDO8635389.1 response regulator transcription factor [Dehalococcoidia bacterium]